MQRKQDGPFVLVVAVVLLAMVIWLWYRDTQAMSACLKSGETVGRCNELMH